MKKFFLLGLLAVSALTFTAFRNADILESPNSTANITAVGTPMPDLIIQDVSIICSSQRWLVFYVKNQGAAKSIATLVRVRPQDNDDPTQHCIAQAVKNVSARLPGSRIKIRIPLKTAGEGCDCLGCLKIELFVDHNNYVVESDETNNEVLYTPNCL